MEADRDCLLATWQRPSPGIVEEPTRIFATGSTGFVGSHLVNRIGHGAALRALVRPTSAVSHLDAARVERIAGTLEDPDALARGADGADVVLHMAAVTHAGSEAEFERVNVEGTQRLVEALLRAERRPRRLVYLSSLAAVGPTRDGRPVGRDETPAPLTAYGRSKLAGEAVCREAERLGVEVVILRAAAVYGPGDRDLYSFFRLASLGIRPVPTGPVRRLQLLYVRDLADALVRSISAPSASGVYHLAEPNSYTWDEVTRKVAASVGRKGVRVPVPALGIRALAAVAETAGRMTGGVGIFNRDKARELLAPGWTCETDAAGAELGFTAPTALKDGLAETAAWYRAQGWL